MHALEALLHALAALSAAGSQLFGQATGGAQTWLFVTIVQPLLWHLHMMDLEDMAYDSLLWVVYGALQLLLVYAVLRPLEWLAPLERWENRRGIGTDVIYTLFNRLGLLPLLLFLTLQPWFDLALAWLHLHGVDNLNLDALWPGMSLHPLAGFLIYLVVLDFAGYWYHRWQHQIGWWWELHAVHHSQRKVSLWADDRNHFLDDALQAAFFAALALFIGVPPAQFVALTLVGGALQSVQHANMRFDFGRIGERLLVGPRFHRLHHAVGFGHELGHGNRARLYGCNFGVLLPWWDMLFGSADYGTPLQPTGVRAQLPAPEGAGENYGEGLWAQQGLAFVRIGRRAAAALRGRARVQPGV